MLVEIAGAGGGVEDGARLVVGELFEEDSLVVILGEDACDGIAWKPGVEAGEGSGYSLVDAFGADWIGLGEACEAFAETGCVFVGYGEDSDAALGAAGAAGEMRSRCGLRREAKAASTIG